MRSARAGWITSAALLVTVANFNLPSRMVGAPHWKIYRSTVHGYELQFPASWRLNEGRPDDFEIFNFPEEKSVRGVILPKGGAMLGVGTNFEGKATVDEWIEADLKSAVEKSKVTKRKVGLPRRTRTGPGSCVEVTWDWEVGPKTFSRETACYFSLGGKLFKAQVSYWKDDRDQAAYRNLLRRIIGTLSTLPSKRATREKTDK